MLKKTISGIMLTFLLISMLSSAFTLVIAEVHETTSIRPKGEVSECGFFGKSFSTLASFIPPPTEWNRTYGGTGYDWGHSVVPTADGGYAIAGYTTSFGAGGYDFWLVKTDSSGNMVWNKTYGGTNTDYAYSIVQTTDGGYAIAGYTYAPPWGSFEFWLVKTDSDGNLIWSRTYGGYGPEYGYSVVQTTDGGYAMAGDTNSFGPQDFWLVKTDSDGYQKWSKEYGGDYWECAHSLKQTSDGGYIMAGLAQSYGAGWLDFWLVKTDSSGNIQWTRTYGGASEDVAWSVVQTNDGGYAIAGYTMSFGAGSDDFWLVKTDSSGNKQWSQTYGGASTDYAYSVVQTADGGYAIAGMTYSFGAGQSDFWLVKVGPAVHDVAVKNVILSKTVVGQGYPVPIDVVVENQGHFTESFAVTLYVDTAAIGTRNVNNLQPASTSTLTLVWNTTDQLLGSYVVSAEASAVLGETHIADNTYIDGTVRIIEPPWTIWNHYHNYTEIVDILDYLNATYPSIVDVFSIGKSWQNRDIYCIKLTNESNTHLKPKLFFVGYHHARELISAELPLYFAVEAATNFGTNETITHMLNYSEIYIVPALNVDAFDTVKQNEWQRKNAHPYNEDGDGLLDEDPPDDEDADGYIEDLYYWDGSTYYFIRWEGLDDDSDGSYNEDWIGGVDLNRNYGYQWNATCYSGSPYPWAEDYRGPAPFSEPETQAIRDLALSNNFKYAISFHSGTESIGYPWGYTYDPTPDDAIFSEIGANLSALVGAPYGPNSNLYTLSGSWDDWMYANRSTFPFTCEIYGNDTAWQYEPGPDPYTWWEKGVFQFFNPDPNNIEAVVQRWLPVFTYVTERAITEAYAITTTNVNPLKTIVGQGFSMHINVTVTNHGDFTETFNVTVYADTSLIETRQVTLPSEQTTTIAFKWVTTGFAKGTYTISAIAEPVQGETNTEDNRLVNGQVKVLTPGNVNGDGIVNMQDIYAELILRFMRKQGEPGYSANSDINDDGVINYQDIYIAILHFMDTDP